MWIRSQNKEMLIECNCFFIDRYSLGYEFIGNDYTLGTYSTKEKALKVLDMINKLLSTHSKRYSKVQYYARENRGLIDYDLQELVFQMPQDDEI